jgi:Zn finger protein HypA/HybF involved in hydrogenase expression
MQGQKAEIKCLECGAKFKRTITAHTFEIPCPKCHGIDTEIA